MEIHFLRQATILSRIIGENMQMLKFVICMPRWPNRAVEPE